MDDSQNEFGEWQLSLPFESNPVTDLIQKPVDIDIELDTEDQDVLGFQSS